MSASKSELYDAFGQGLETGNAALFVGAGLSAGAGFMDWRGLLKGIAKQLGLNIEKETDLLAVAQYHVNDRMGNRTEIDQLIVDEFKTRAKRHLNHDLIADLDLSTVWTTNYDHLLEQAFERAHKVVDAIIESKDLRITSPRRDVVVYKMHGDVSRPSEAVLTKDDYIAYASTRERELFLSVLRSDLVSKTFLFLGFSFDDPNIEFVLGNLHLALLGQTKKHFCVMRKPQQKHFSKTPESPKPEELADYEYALRKFTLRKVDLKRYGVHTVEITEYDEITEVLQELRRRSRLNDIFVSGSAHTYEPLGQAVIDQFARKLGDSIIKNECNLISGFGLGIGGSVIIGALERLYSEPKRDLSKRLTLRPFPQNFSSDAERIKIWRQYREDMISNAGFCLFLCGNKLKEGDVVEADGMLQEWEICKERKKYPLPVGASGHVANKIHREVIANLEDYYPGLPQVREHLETLNNTQAGIDAWLESIFHIIDLAGQKAE
jgi:hypothetical protein